VIEVQGVARVLQGCNKGVTSELQGVTRVLREFYKVSPVLIRVESLSSNSRVLSNPSHWSLHTGRQGLVGLVGLEGLAG
jgi:hypothetical protein